MKRNAQGASRLNQLKEAKKYSTEKGVPLAYALREMRMLRNGGPIQDPPVRPERNNSDGSVSTHLMEWGSTDNGAIAYPTIFPTYKGTPSRNPVSNDVAFWTQESGRQAGDRSIRSGEVRMFNNPNDAQAYADGAWKQPIQPRMLRNGGPGDPPEKPKTQVTGGYRQGNTVYLNDPEEYAYRAQMHSDSTAARNAQLNLLEQYTNPDSEFFAGRREYVENNLTSDQIKELDNTYRDWGAKNGVIPYVIVGEGYEPGGGKSITDEYYKIHGLKDAERNYSLATPSYAGSVSSDGDSETSPYVPLNPDTANVFELPIPDGPKVNVKRAQEQIADLKPINPFVPLTSTQITRPPENKIQGLYSINSGGGIRILYDNGETKDFQKGSPEYNAFMITNRKNIEEVRMNRNQKTMQYGGNINSPFVKMLFNGGPTNPGGPGDPPIPQVKKKTEEKPKINAATGMLEPSVPNLKPVSTYQPSKPKQPTESLDVRSNTAKQLSSLVIDFKTDKKKVDEINKQFHKIYWAPNTKRNCTAGALNCNTDYISKNLPNVNPIRKMIEENGNYQNYLIPQNVIKGRTDLTAVNQSIDAWEMSNYLTSENLGSYIYNNPENTNVDDKFLEGIDLSKVTIGTLIGQGDARGVYVPNLESGTPRHLFTVAAFDVDGMPLIYDGGKMVRLDSPNVLGTSMPILSMVVPKGYESYTFDNVSKQLKSKTTKLNDEPEFTPSLDLKGKEIAPQIENVYKSALSVRDQVSVEYDIPTSVLNQFINALPGIANEESKINNYNGFSPRTFFGDVPLMNAVGKPLVKVAKNVAMSIPNSYRPEGVQDYVLEMQAYDRYGRNDKEREAYFNKLKEQNQFSDYPYENLKSSVGPFAIKDFPEYATQAYGIRRFDLYGTTVSNDAQLTKGSKVALILLAEKFNNLKKQYPNLTEEQLVDLSIVNYNNVSKSNDPNFVDFYIVNKKLPDRYLNAVKSFKL